MWNWFHDFDPEIICPVPILTPWPSWPHPLTPLTLCVQGSELAYLYGILLIVVFPLLTGLFGYFAIKYSNSKRREVRAPRANQIAKKRW
jgi:hypothetical protein